MSRTEYIKPNDYNKVYMVMQYDNALALRTSLETGLRIGDVLALKPENIQGRTIHCTAQKTGKTVKKTISADLCNRLKQIAGDKWIFTGRDGTDHKTRGALWKDVKKASKELGFSVNFGCHSARKTYAVELFKEHGITDVQKELQHDNLETTLLYVFAHLLKQDVPTSDTAVTDLSDTETEKEFAEAVALRVVEILEQKFCIDNKADTD